MVNQAHSVVCFNSMSAMDILSFTVVVSFSHGISSHTGFAFRGISCTNTDSVSSVVCIGDCFLCYSSLAAVRGIEQAVAEILLKHSPMPKLTFRGRNDRVPQC